MISSVPRTESTTEPLTERQLRVVLYRSAVLTALLPPFVGGTLMAMVGFYPFPEIFLIFTEWHTLLYIFALLVAALAAARWFAQVLVCGESPMPAARLADIQRHVSRLPWILFCVPTLYSIGGVLIADFTLESKGVATYQAGEHIRNQLGLIPVVLITVFPIFFDLTNGLGRYLGPRGVVATAIPLWMKLAMLGVGTPLLATSLLVSHHINHSSSIEWSLVAGWLILVLFTIGGTWIAWQSLRQGLSPFRSFLASPNLSLAERARTTLTPSSLDELGVLTARYEEMLESLQRAESLASAVIDHAGVLVLVLDHDGRIVRFNRAAERLSGLTFAEVVDKYPWDTFLPPEDAETVRKNAFDALARNPQALSGHYTNAWMHRSGQRYLTEWTNTVVLDRHGRMEFMVAIGADVTERNQRETELRESEERLATLLRVSGELAGANTYNDVLAVLQRTIREAVGYRNSWVFLTSADERHFELVSAHGETAGNVSDGSPLARMEIETDPLLRTIADATEPVVIEDMRNSTHVDHKKAAVLDNRTTINIPLRDGEKCVGVLGTGTFGDEGVRLPTPSQLIFLRTLARNVATTLARIQSSDAIRNSEDRLRRNEAWLRHAQAIANVGSWELDLATDRLRWSDETANIFGRDPSTHGENYEMFLDAVHPADREAVDRAYRASVTDRTPYDISHRIVRPDGTARWVHERGETVYDAEGRALRTVGAAQDITERVRHEQALSTSNQMLSAVVDTTPVLIAYLDANMNFLRVNAAYAAADGKAPAYFVGKNHFALFPNAENEQIFRRVAETGEAYSAHAKPFEYEFNPERGVSHWDWTLTPIKNDAGRVTGLVLSLLNVTDRIVALENISRSETRLRELNEDLEKAVTARVGELREERNFVSTVLDIAGALVVVFDAQGRIVRFNRQCEKITGYLASEIVGEFLWARLLPAEMVDYVRHVFGHLGENSLPMNYQNHWVTRDGTPRLIAWSNSLLHAENGVIQYIVSVGIDITEKDKAERALVENANRLAAAQRVARVGDYELDIPTGRLFWSDMVFELAGYKPGGITPSPDALLERIHPDDRDIFRATLAEGLSSDDPRNAGRTTALPSIDYRLQLPSGDTRWIHAEANLRFGDDGQPRTLFGTAQDITERKQIESQLIEARDRAELANRAKNEFLARMSHELRTPMNAILGFAQVLEMEKLADEQIEFVHEIHRAGDHLLDLINELLDLSRIESGRLAVAIRPLPLDAIMSEAVRMAQPAIDQQRVALINQCQSSAQVLADATRLRQIFVNLLTNAAKYNRPGGRITLNCQPLATGHLRVAVTDTGTGIAPDRMTRLFQPFERLGAENGPVEGAGIGLALSKQLAELMNSTLGVDSVHGQGSTFWIDIPLAPETAGNHRPIPADVVTDDAAPSLTALYIEDNPANLRLVEAALRRVPGVRLLSATSGPQGLELAQKYLPHLILVDIHLPDMDGYAVLAALRADERTRHVPAVALSADAMPIDIERGLKAGFDRYLTKPVKLDDLLAVAREFGANRPK